MKSISRNYLYNLSYQILTLLTPLITAPYISRTLGVNGIGEYSFSYSIVAYFVLLAGFGIPSYAQREIAYNQDDPYGQSRIFWEVISLQIIFVTLSLTGYYTLGKVWGVDSQIYWVQALNIVAIFFDVSWFFQGLEEFGKIVFRNFLVRIVNIALLFLLVKTPDDLILYTFIMAGMNVVSGLLICLFLKNYIRRVPISEIHPFHNISTVLQLFLPQIAIQVYVILDKTMLGFWADTYIENGYYEQADKIVKMCLSVATSLGTVMLPRIAFTFAQGSIEKVREYMMKSYRFIFFLSIPMCFGLIVTASNFVPWFFGPGYEPVAKLIAIESTVIITIGLSNVTGVQFMVPTKRQNELTFSVAAGAIFNFVINLFLIPAFMSTGVAIATALTELVVTTVQFWLVRDFFSVKEILKQCRTYLAGSIVMIFGVSFLAKTLSPSILHTLILIIVGGLMYIACLLLMKDDMLCLAIGKVKRKFSH